MTDVYSSPEYFRFIAAIRERPDDDLPRLMCADWLEEHGEGDRAAFVRVQVERGRLERESTENPVLIREWQSVYEMEMKLRPKGDRFYFGKGDYDYTTEFTFSRGFLEEIRIRGADWIEHATEILKRNPVRKVTLFFDSGPPNPATGVDYIIPVWGSPQFRHLRVIRSEDGGPIACYQFPGIQFTFEREPIRVQTAPVEAFSMGWTTQFTAEEAVRNRIYQSLGVPARILRGEA